MWRAALLSGILLTAVGAVGWSGASFSAPARHNPGNSFTAHTLAPATGLTATASGRDVALSWTAAPFATSYQVAGGAGNASCSGVTYGAVGTAATTAFSDPGRYTPQGTWQCYRVGTTYRSYTSLSGDPQAAVQLGFVATGVTLSPNGSLLATLDTGDRIDVTFNQPVSAASRPAATSKVCARDSSDTVFLATTTTSGACGVGGEVVQLGRMTGVPITTGTDPRWDATYAWNAAGTQVTITLGARIAGATDAVLAAGTFTFAPTSVAGFLESATGAFHICDTNSGGGNCLPAVSGNF